MTVGTDATVTPDGYARPVFFLGTCNVFGVEGRGVAPIILQAHACLRRVSRYHRRLLLLAGSPRLRWAGLSHDARESRLSWSSCRDSH